MGKFSNPVATHPRTNEVLGNPFNLFHAPGGGYIIFHNSCPLLDSSIVCEKRNCKQLNFYQYQQLPFCHIHSSCDLQIGRSILKSLSSVLILSHILLISMVSKELRMGLSMDGMVWSICEILLTLGFTFPTFH